MYLAIVILAAMLCGGLARISKHGDICGQVQALGYPCEHHAVHTDDGFLLDTLHIPSPKGAGYPIILVHGLFDAASAWVANYYPRQNLACLLRDAGYDVWLVNSRGNVYSLNNTNYAPYTPKKRDEDFWESIDVDGMIQYDVPACIDYVLNATGRKTLSYIGHSQGTSMAFGAFATYPQYAAKVDLFVALAPIVYLHHAYNGIWNYWAPYYDTIVKLLGMKELMGDTFTTLINKAVYEFCENPLYLVPCTTYFNMIFGVGDPSILNYTQQAAMSKYYPAGSSALNYIHWIQITISDIFRKHDYGPEKNMKKYGQRTPPVYNLSAYQGPKLAAFTGNSDAIADPADVAHLLAQLPQDLIVKTKTLSVWNHVDFVYAITAWSQVYQDVLKLLKIYTVKS